MQKVLVLVVDRDDDFGYKGHVATPCIGIDACSAAATALGTADPEDSDTNALYAAMNIYRDLETDHEPGTFEIALICGDQKVGHRSDTKVVDELEHVLAQIGPTRAILVDDGAEDESVFPIVSSRIPIDSVRKVFVKQAPSVEGTFYVISRYFKDPQKRQRFLAPISWTIFIVCIAFLLINFFIVDTVRAYLTRSTTTLIFLVFSQLMLVYSYHIDNKIHNLLSMFSSRAKNGSILVVFLSAALLLFVFGIVLGIYSLDNIYTTRTTERVLVFAANAMWPILFGVMMLHFGIIVDGYMSRRSVRYVNIIGCLNVLAIGLIMTGALDYLISYTGLYSTALVIIFMEVLGGLFMAVFASVTHRRMKAVAEFVKSRKMERV